MRFYDKNIASATSVFTATISTIFTSVSLKPEAEIPKKPHVYITTPNQFA